MVTEQRRIDKAKGRRANKRNRTISEALKGSILRRKTRQKSSRRSYQQI